MCNLEPTVGSTVQYHGSIKRLHGEYILIEAQMSRYGKHNITYTLWDEESNISLNCGRDGFTVLSES